MSSTFLSIILVLLATTVSFSTSASIVKRDTAPTATYAQFLGIQTGWTRQQITQYLNNTSGVVMSETQADTLNILQLRYTGSMPYSVVILILSNNKLISKGQSGLDTNKYAISRQQFDQINMGTTKSQVTQIVGSAGQIGSQAFNSSEVMTYNGNINPYAIVQITYLQGKVVGRLAVGL